MGEALRVSAEQVPRSVNQVPHGCQTLFRSRVPRPELQVMLASLELVGWIDWWMPHRLSLHAEESPKEEEREGRPVPLRPLQVELPQELTTIFWTG